MPSDAAAARVPAVVERLRLAAVVLALWLLTFTQSSGHPAADTKLDLVVTPARFLSNALRMWDPNAASGQMQDQAYGYLFPMGPAFLLGKIVALPAWVMQRSWESLLLTVAFLGAMRVARLLGVRGFVPLVGAGLAYALAPRMLSELTVISAELIPVALLPWVLAPLITGATSGSPRRAAARSGIAYAFVGGINASAALAILPVPALWLLTRGRGPRRRSLLLWWLVAIVAASLWWLVPLVVLGKYSPPFLDWIESSSVTTRVTDLVDVLRGTDHWQAFLGPHEWPGAWTLVSAGGAILGTVAVAALGLAGLARRRIPHRGFLVSSLLVGIVAVTLGHDASVGPLFAHGFRTLLDGPLKAFRNVHKFDPILRLPLAVGVGHALAAIGARVPSEITLRWRSLIVFPRALVAVALAGLAALAISPLLTGDLVPQTRSVADAVWWQQTGQWLGAHEAQGRALVVPGAAQPAYVWGAPRDDALQPYADGPWAVRDAAPLGQPGYVRLLDAVEAMLAAGQPDPTLAPLLAGAGIQYLVIRNDLDIARSGATPLRFVHATVQNSPGWTQVASFGAVFLGRDDPARLVDDGLLTSPDAVQIYANADFTSGVSLLPADGVVVANGSTDALPVLLGSGLGANTPVLTAADASAVRAAGVPIATALDDGIRKREFGFGAVDRYSATMTAAQAFSAQRRVHDYLPPGVGPGGLTVARYDGIANVRASTSAADIVGGHVSPATSPWAALDGDPHTAWQSSTLSGAVGQWLQVDLLAPTTLTSLQLRLGTGSGPPPIRVRVSTDTGVLDQDVTPADVVQSLRVPTGPTQRVRVTALAVADGSRGGRFAVSELDLGGVDATRTLVVPGAMSPDVIAFQVAAGYRPACLSVTGGTAGCDPSWGSAGEEDTALDRTFSMSDSVAYAPRAGVRFVPGPALDALLDAPTSIRVIASSRDSADPRERPGAVLDGDAHTGWVAHAGDLHATLTLALPAPARLTGVTLSPLADAPVTRPTEVQVHAGDETITATVPDDGTVQFPSAVVTDSVSITVTASTLRTSTDSATGIAHQLPVGIGEVRLEGTGVPTVHPAQQVVLGCDQVPSLDLDGRTLAIKVTASTTDVLLGHVITAQPCASAPVLLVAGPHRVRLAGTALVDPVSMTFVRAGSTVPTATPGTAVVQHWGATDRRVRVDATTVSLLVVRENENAGWRATLSGRVLQPVTIDGWQQGWLVPAGSSGTVHLVFTPQRGVDVGFAVGAGALVLLLLGAFARPRRTLPAALDDGTLPIRVVSGLAFLAALVIGAATGVVIAAVVGGAVVVLARRGHRLPAWGAAAVFAVAGVMQMMRPPGSAHALGNSPAVQTLCLLALALLVAAAAPRPAEPAQQRSLEQPPRHRGHRGRAQRGDQEELGEVTAERPPAERLLDDQ